MSQVVWITGASSGIGAALARGWARRGSRLVLSGRNRDALSQVATECRADSLILPFEATDYAAAQAAAEQAWEWRGGIDVLVNNAGISQRSLAIDTAFAVYERMIAVDLLAPICLTQALIARMAARGSGHIVNISSIAGKVGVPLRTAYCAAKFGLAGYGDAVRAETGHLGIQVHNVFPGSIRTNVSRNSITADGSPRGSSDRAIDNGIDPDAAAEQMIAAIEQGEAEIIIAAGREREMGEARRTPQALIDQVGEIMAKGYAQKMEIERK